MHFAAFLKEAKDRENLLYVEYTPKAEKMQIHPVGESANSCQETPS